MCAEHERLAKIHRDALQEWTKAGRKMPTDPQKPETAELWQKIDEAESAVIKHRKAHKC